MTYLESLKNSTKTKDEFLDKLLNEHIFPVTYPMSRAVRKNLKGLFLKSLEINQSDTFKVGIKYYINL